MPPDQSCHDPSQTSASRTYVFDGESLISFSLTGREGLVGTLRHVSSRHTIPPDSMDVSKPSQVPFKPTELVAAGLMRYNNMHGLRRSPREKVVTHQKSSFFFLQKPLNQNFKTGLYGGRNFGSSEYLRFSNLDYDASGIYIHLVGRGEKK